MRLLLDSAFVIDHLRGEPAALDQWRRVFAESDEPFVNEVVICEVRSGLRASDEPKLLALMEPVEFIQPGRDASVTAGRWRRDAFERGHQLSLADALIAAAADAVGARVLTRNHRDFALTPVRVESY